MYASNRDTLKIKVSNPIAQLSENSYTDQLDIKKSPEMK